MNELIKPSVVAKQLGVTTVTVRNWVRAGKLKAFRTPGGHYLIFKHSFEELLANMQSIALSTK